MDLVAQSMNYSNSKKQPADSSQQNELDDI